MINRMSASQDAAQAGHVPAHAPACTVLTIGMRTSEYDVTHDALATTGEGYPNPAVASSGTTCFIRNASLHDAASTMRLSALRLQETNRM